MGEPNGEAKADRSNIGAWEKWTVTFVDKDKVQFKNSQHGKYLAAEPNGNVNANRVVASHYETWTVVDKGFGKFTFKSYFGKYLVAEPNGDVNANRVVANQYETFEVSVITSLTGKPDLTAIIPGLVAKQEGC